MTPENHNVMPDFCNRRHPLHYVTALNILMKMGVDINQVDILAVGEYENYKGEVHHQSPPPGAPLNKDTRIVLKVGFPSAVDYMPYQIFYGIAGITSRATEWEDKARAFMAPFDAARVRHEAVARHQLLKYTFGVTDLTHLNEYLKLFNFSLPPESRNLDDALLWSVLLPSFHFWAGNPVLTERILHHIFGYDFRIVEWTEAVYDIPAELQTRLGKKSTRLGKEFILGRSFSECDSSYEIRISGVSADDVIGLLPGKPLRRKLEWVLSICMPNNLDYKITIKVDSCVFAIGATKTRRYLGYSTYIHK
jgi:hypothetical protein